MKGKTGMKKSARKKRMARKILLILCIMLAVYIVYLFCKAMWYGRGTSEARTAPGRIELSYEEAAADGSISFGPRLICLPQFWSHLL